MKKLLLVTLIAIVCAVSWWLWSNHRVRIESESNSGKFGATHSPKNFVSSLPAKPRIFKSDVYPPKTPEERAMWEWWRAMQKIDPNFEWKTPISFYGKVIDQFGKPVSGAKVEFTLSVVNGTTTTGKITSDDGVFQLSDAKGKGLSISINKEGYASIPGKARKSFEYAAFYRADFLVPDKSNPIIFELHKIVNAEPTYVYHASGVLKTDGTQKLLNVTKGTLGQDGDISFRINYVEGGASNGPGYSITLEAQRGAGLILREEEDQTVAPDSGYIESVILLQKMDGMNIPTKKISFFVKTNSNKYAHAYVEITMTSEKLVDISATVNYNPSGSKNLEFDSKKWLNRH